MTPRWYEIFTFGMVVSCIALADPLTPRELNLLTELNEILREAERSPTYCGLEDFPFSTQAYCLADRFCQDTFRKNRDSFFIYESDDGRKVPNVPLLTALDSGYRCVHNSVSSSSREGEAKAKTEAREKELWRVIEASGERWKYNKVLSALRMGILKEKSSWSDWLTTWWVGAESKVLHSEDLEKRLAAAEKAAGVALSQPVKDAWLRIFDAKDYPPKSRNYVDTISDPFLNPAKLYDPRVAPSKEDREKNRALYAARLQDARELFSEAKEKFLRKLEALADSPARANLISRVRSVALVLPETFPSEDTCTDVNAFYDRSNRITLCSAVLNLPKPALFQLLAHELAHAIDPCSTSLGVFHYHLRESATNLREKISAASRRRDAVEASYLRLGAEAIKPKPKDSPLSPDYAMGASAEKALLGLVSRKEGYHNLKMEDFDITEYAQAVLFQDHPFRGVMNCLASDRSINARLTNSHSPPKASEEEKFCSGNGYPSQIGEAFADWVSAELLAEKINERVSEKERRQWAFESISLHSSVGCTAIPPEPTSMREEKLLETMREANPIFCKLEPYRDASKSFLEHRHPPTLSRIDYLFFVKKEYQKALSCGPFPWKEECK